VALKKGHSFTDKDCFHVSCRQYFAIVNIVYIQVYHIIAEACQKTISTLRFIHITIQ